MTRSSSSRIFLPWDRPALPQAAGVLCDHYGDNARAEARMDDAVIVVPGARAGRRLKELLAEEAERRGLRLVPPRVVTMGVLPELLYEADRPVASAAVRRLVWSRALREAPRERLGTVFARLPEEGALLEWAALGRELASLARSVARGGYRFHQVAEQCRGGSFFDDAERWRILAGVQDRMEALLDELGRVDPDLARMEALEAGAVSTDGEIWLVGIAEMPGVARRMLEAGGGPVRALVHAPEERADDFDALGCVRVEAWSRAHLPLDEARIAISDRPQDQAVAVARTLAGLDGARTTDEISLGVPMPEVIPFLEQRLGRAGVPVRDAAGTPLSSTGPFRLLAAVAAFLDDRRYDALAALVRHPDLGRWLREHAGDEPSLGRTDAWLIPLDEWYNDHLPARMVAPYPGRERSRGQSVEALMERLDGGLLSSLGGSRRLSAWVEPVLELLAAVYGPHRLSQTTPSDRSTVRALAEIRWAAEAFAHLPESLDGQCTASRAIRLILDEASPVAIPPEADDRAVEMLGWLELHLDDAPVTVLTGVNEGALPESVRGDPFLPDALRAHLGLEDNQLRHARDVYRMAAMLHSREALHLVVGRRTVEGDPLRPSRLLFQADDATVAGRVRRFYDPDADAGGRDTATPAEDADREPPAPDADASGFVLPPEGEIPLGSVRDRLRVTDFRALLADPYTFALRRVRNLEPLDDRAREMDGALFGSVAHDVLEAFGRSQAVHRTDPREAAAALERLLDDEVARRFGTQARVTVRLQVEQLRARLRAFARWHAARVADGWRVLAVEAGTPEGGVPFDVDGEPVGLVARIDRIEHHPERGLYAVFDYKTGDRGKEPDRVHRKGRSRKEWVDLQLPLYRWLAPRLTDAEGRPLIPEGPGAGHPEIQLGYILLPRDLDGVGESLAEWSDAEIKEAIERARDVVRELRSGPAVWDPDRKPAFADDRLEALVGRGVLTGANAEYEEDQDEDR